MHTTATFDVTTTWAVFAAVFTELVEGEQVAEVRPTPFGVVKARLNVPGLIWMTALCPDPPTVLTVKFSAGSGEVKV